ncbi:MAG: tyrosinase family protein [Candidatus Cybelea sp.]
MPPRHRLTRANFIKRASVTTGAAVFATAALDPIGALSQDPPQCPTPPSGGTHFVPGQDARAIVLRKPISGLSASELATLQSAFSALRNLPESDVRSWKQQADMHALYCDQCNNDTAQIHFSWTFFPWHRAYLYYFERILGKLAGDLANFRLPYWDWENDAHLPAPYASPNNSGNFLWDTNRNAGLAGGGVLETIDSDPPLSSRVPFLYTIYDFTTFGGTAQPVGPTAMGACESDPHGNVHTATGLPEPVYRDMGDLGYAARDPIFFAHHSNIDKIWSRWNKLATSTSGGPSGAYQNPTNSAFLNERWSFYDENGNTVSISASDVLDYKNNLRYAYDPIRLLVLPLWEIYVCKLLYNPPDPGPMLPITSIERSGIFEALDRGSPVALVLQGVSLPENASGSYEIAAVRAKERIALGTFTIVPGSMKMSGREANLAFDITGVVRPLFASGASARLEVFAVRGKEVAGAPAYRLTIRHAEFRTRRVQQSATQS